jgi:iron(III) transport system permease protein
VLLYRTDLPGRRSLRLLTVLTLFVPLPLFTSGWQTVLGAGGWLPSALWNPVRESDPGLASGGSAWTPWGQGIGSAVWVHALAGLPWVVLLVGQGLCWVERELEEDRLLAAPPWRVLLRVSLPRSGAAVAAAALWVAVQTAGEITVTDVMQVRTFAEEVYAQFVGPQVDASGGGRGDVVSRAVVVALPLVLLVALLIVGMARRWERSLPPRRGMAEPLVFPLGRMRWPAWVLAAATSAVLLGVPLGSLVWRAGLSGAPPAWSLTTTCHSLARVWRAEGERALDSLLVGGAAGVFCAALGLVTCWAALGTRWFRGGVLALMALAWALPGPVTGLALKDVTGRLLDLTGSALLARWLWYGPSVLPVLWVDVIRFFPCAVAVLWPVVRLLPPDLRDAARVDGLPPGGELRHVVWPLTSVACLRAALAVAVLSLGELSGSKLVSTPGRPSYAEVIFTQMHFGVTNDLAARCLVLLALVGLGGALVAALGRRRGGPRP